MKTAMTGMTSSSRPRGRRVRWLAVAIGATLGFGNGGALPVSRSDASAATSRAEQGNTKLEEAKFLIEHNAAEDDTGLQLFVDGEPWSRLTVNGPGGGVVEINALGQLAGFGLTEGFFETNEPPAEEFPLEDVLALFPEGRYEFEATSVSDGTIQRGTATLSHAIPEEPEILAPAEGARVDPRNLVVSWNPVERSLTGGNVNIEGYQVVIEKDVDLKPSASLFKSELSVFVPASATSLTVPSEFLEPGTAYEVEVLAIDRNGNQTIGLRAFETE